VISFRFEEHDVDVTEKKTLGSGQRKVLGWMMRCGDRSQWDWADDDDYGSGPIRILDSLVALGLVTRTVIAHHGTVTVTYRAKPGKDL
jgi:hypothetical protein